MIHIKRSTDKKFYVTVVARNGKVLSTSETLNSRKSVYNNIAAMCEAFWFDYIEVHDNTLKNPKTYKYNKRSGKLLEIVQKNNSCSYEN